MRLYSIAHLGAAALQICVSSSSDFYETDVSTPTKAHSNVHDHSSITSTEERMPQNGVTFVSKELSGIPQGIIRSALGVLRANRNADMLTEKSLDRLEDVDFHVLAPFAAEIHRVRKGKKYRSTYRKNVLYRLIIKQALDSKDGEWHLVRAIMSLKRMLMGKHHHAKRDMVEKNSDQYFDLDFSVKSGVTFKGFESLNWLSKDFGGVAKLAPIVSIAKKSQVIGHRAQKLQSEMLTRWLDSDKLVDEVFGILDLSDLRNKGFTYENLDTLEQYIGAYNKKQEHGVQIDMFTYLRGKFGDGELAMMILEGTMTPQFVTESGVIQLVGAGKSTVDFVSTILIIAVDVDSLLNPLLLAFGGVAKLAPIVSSAKKNYVARTDAKRLQSAMLARWLNSGKSIGDVVNILELSNLSKRDFTYEDVDTLQQYIAVLTQKSGGLTDTFKYLKEKFENDELAMMLLEKTEQFQQSNSHKKARLQY